MAGKIIADIIEAPYDKITLNVGNTVVASMNASGLYTSTGNLLITQANQIGTAALPAGTVLQVVHSTYATYATGTAGAEVYTGASASITPTSSSSKVLVFVDAPIAEIGTKSNFAVVWKLRAGTSTSSTLLTAQRQGHYQGSTVAAERFATLSFNYLDEPASTSAVTYGLFVENLDGAPTWTLNQNSTNGTKFTLMEIAA